MDKHLERAIDNIGRDKVFSHAMALGWPPGSAVPGVVWWKIVRSLREQQGSVHTYVSAG